MSYIVDDADRIPIEGKLFYQGYEVSDIVDNAWKNGRYGFEEVAFLLMTGELPTESELNDFKKLLAESRPLPAGFTEDMILKAPSPDVMNKLARSVLALYSYDPNPDDISPENVLRQCIQLIAQIPVILTSAYQVKRRVYDKKSMYFHQNKPGLTTAESILRSIRPDKQFTDDEAKLLDVCMIIHAEHGGGNNSTFTNRCITSSGTDTYSAIAAGIGSLKGPRHGGANIKVFKMIEDMKANIQNYTDEGQVADYITKIMNKQANDGSGLVYGMGHAVYTLSDPRAVILRRYADKFSKMCGREEEFRLLNLIEELTPELFAKHRGINKRMSANVDLYSGLVYDMLGIPQDLFTPIFMAARMAGWSAHRIEELTTGGRIIRPAYKNVTIPREYVPMSERVHRTKGVQAEYIPIEER
jgi:citrate synthase